MSRLTASCLLGGFSVVAFSCSSSGDGGSGGGGDAPCETASTVLIADQPRGLAELHSAGDRLVFASKDVRAVDGLTNIDSMKEDGSDRRTLYTDSADLHVRSVHADAETVYFLQESDTGARETALMTMPIAGGMPTRLGAGSFGAGRLIWADATAVYLSRLPTSGPVFERVSRTDGSVTTIARVDGAGTPSQSQWFGGSIYFRAGKQGGGEKSHLYRIDAAATNATAARVFPEGGDATLCEVNLAGFVVTPSRLVCGLAGVKSSAHDGSDVRQIVPNMIATTTNIVLGADAETLFVLRQKSSSATSDGRIQTMGSDGSGLAPRACNVGLVQNRQADLVFPIATEYDVAVTPRAFVWIEYAAAGGGTLFSMRSAPR